MKKIYLLATAFVACMIGGSANAQTLDTLSQPDPASDIVDVVKKGPLLFATAGANVYKSADDGNTWTACAPVPDFLMFDERPQHMLVTSDGALYVAVTSFYSAMGAAWTIGLMKTTDNGASWITMDAFAGTNTYEESMHLEELPGGKLIMFVDYGNSYSGTLTSTAFVKGTATSQVYGSMTAGDTVITAGGGIKYTVDMGATWNTYAISTNSSMNLWGSVVFAKTSTHRYGGYWPNVARSNGNSHNFVDLNPTLTSGTPSYYPKQIVVDGNEDLFMTYTDAAGGLFLGKSVDQGQTWTNLISTTGAVFTKMLVHGDDLVGARGKSIVRVQNVAAPTGITEVENKPVMLTVYPNPAGQQLTVAMPAGEQMTTVQVYNMQMQAQQVSVSGNTVSTGNLPAGMYIAKIQSGQNQYHAQFMVQH